MKVHVHIKEREFEEAVARANLTYLDLAVKLGISRIYLSNMKNEKLPEFKPSASLRKKILEVLNVKFDDIFEIRQMEDKQVNDGCGEVEREDSNRPAESQGVGENIG